MLLKYLLDIRYKTGRRKKEKFTLLNLISVAICLVHSLGGGGGGGGGDGVLIREKQEMATGQSGPSLEMVCPLQPTVKFCF